MGILDSIGSGAMNVYRGGKDVVRTVPILGDVLGLSSPEDIAAQRQRRALTESGTQLTPAYEAAAASFAPIAGLSGGLGSLQQRAQAGQFTPQFTPGQSERFQFNLESDPSFQFAQQQGLQGVRDQFAGTGLKGRELQELAEFSTGLASQYAPQLRQQAFNEFQQGQNQRLAEEQLAGRLGQQQFGQELALGQIGVGGLAAQTGFQTDLASQLAGLTQQRGQVGAAQAMGNAGQIRNLINQGAQAAGAAFSGGATSAAPMAGGLSQSFQPQIPNNMNFMSGQPNINQFSGVS